MEGEAFMKLNEVEMLRQFTTTYNPYVSKAKLAVVNALKKDKQVSHGGRWRE
jgi:hypothetical protein